MKTKIAKWGNSLGVRLPRDVAKQAGLEDGVSVDLTVDQGRLVMTPVRRKKTLTELLNGITPENTHKEIDFGPPQGREVW